MRVAAMGASPRNARMIRFLAERGIDVDAANKAGKTALMMAADRPCPGAVTALLSAGADALARDEDGVTALMMAASKDRMDSVDCVRLLAPKSDVSAITESGLSATHIAARAGAFSAVLILAGIADLAKELETVLLARATPQIVNIQDNQGRTALMKVLDEGDLEIALFLAPFADPAIRTRKGDTALSIAALIGRERMNRTAKQRAWGLADALSGRASDTEVMAVAAQGLDPTLCPQLRARVEAIELKKSIAKVGLESGAKENERSPTGNRRL